VHALVFQIIEENQQFAGVALKTVQLTGHDFRLRWPFDI
jgi:hypothetical protein